MARNVVFRHAAPDLWFDLVVGIVGIFVYAVRDFHFRYSRTSSRHIFRQRARTAASSVNPKIGMTSGIRSMGLMKYNSAPPMALVLMLRKGGDKRSGTDDLPEESALGGLLGTPRTFAVDYHALVAFHIDMDSWFLHCCLLGLPRYDCLHP